MALPEEAAAAARKSGREVEPGRRALGAEVGEKVEAMAGRRGARGMGAVVVWVCVEGAGEEGIGDKPGGREAISVGRGMLRLEAAAISGWTEARLAVGTEQSMLTAMP